MTSQQAAVRVKNRHFQDASSGDRKKSRTRGLILDAAIEILATRGIERASISEISERAGISNASFYYHFQDKNQLLDAVAGAVAATLVREVDDAIAGVEQGRDRVAMAAMLFIGRGVEDEAWGRLIVHALAEMREFREQISEGIGKDVLIGIQQGQFDVTLSPLLLSMLLGMVGAAMRERLKDLSVGGIDSVAASAVLRALGIPAKHAERIVANARLRLAALDGAGAR